MVTGLTVVAVVAAAWVVAVAVCVVALLVAGHKYRTRQDDEHRVAERERLREVLRGDDVVGWLA